MFKYKILLFTYFLVPFTYFFKIQINSSLLLNKILVNPKNMKFIELPKKPKKTRVFNLKESINIIYIRHLGEQPYNEIKFQCGKKLIVSYSLSYWHQVFQSFHRINRGVLVNPAKISFVNDLQEVILIDDSIFTYSRRMSRKYLS